MIRTLRWLVANAQHENTKAAFSSLILMLLGSLFMLALGAYLQLDHNRGECRDSIVDGDYAVIGIGHYLFDKENTGERVVLVIVEQDNRPLCYQFPAEVVEIRQSTVDKLVVKSYRSFKKVILFSTLITAERTEVKAK